MLNKKAVTGIRYFCRLKGTSIIAGSDVQPYMCSDWLFYLKFSRKTMNVGKLKVGY